MIPLTCVNDSVLHQIRTVPEHLGASTTPQWPFNAGSVVPCHVVFQLQWVLKSLQANATLIKLGGAG